MLETGLGAVAMQTALRWCLHAPRFGTVPYRPRFVISAGFSGALQPEQHVGDVILATEVVDGGKNCWPVTLLPDTQINDAQRRGRLLTWPDLVGDPQEKKRLGRHYQALAVDMETAVLARLCHEHGVPFTCVRVISDDLNTPLSPHLIALLQRGRVSAPRLALSLLRQPTLLGELWHLAGQTRTAAKQLAACLPTNRTRMNANGADDRGSNPRESVCSVFLRFLIRIRRDAADGEAIAAVVLGLFDGASGHPVHGVEIGRGADLGHGETDTHRDPD